MKISERWLREWVNPAASTQEIAERLVMGGLELEIEPAVEELARGVVVARILEAAPHPNASKLQVCTVDVGEASPRQIVCGASNARAGLLAPCALPGAVLPGGLRIETGQLRGVESAGMMCSAKELGLAEKSAGLLELDAAAVPGTPIEDYLALDDQILTLELTPNRGDCLSVLGLAREVAALFDQSLKPVPVHVAPVTMDQALPVQIENSADSPAFVGRLITGINPKASTPDWMRERLRRSGIRCIHPLVDITNFVMIELGQPMHAYDADRLQGGIGPRRARAGESITLLNDQSIVLNGELVIADAQGPVGLAGVMGGASSAVSETTTRVFFESAAFSMAAVAGVARRHKLTSDAAYRFERGVDAQVQERALERATELTLAICGGQVGPISRAATTPRTTQAIPLRAARLEAVLGIPVPETEVEALLARLDIGVTRSAPGLWSAVAPSWRHDLAIEVDLIEEVARLYGYDRIVAGAYSAELPLTRPSEQQRPLYQAKAQLAARGWTEVVNLAFDDAASQSLLNPGTPAYAVDNPIAETATLMRTTLWSALLRNWAHNRSRQVPRARLFEAGSVFSPGADGPIETPMIAGLAAGLAMPEQWGDRERRLVDFYDVKADLEALCSASPATLSFRAARHAALHPGQSAEILLDGHRIGWLGRLHPRAAQQLDLEPAPVLFEIEQAAVSAQRMPRIGALSEHPSSRRDLALLVPRALESEQLCAAARRSAGSLLQRAFVFDEYTGQGVPEGKKSVAMGLIFGDLSRTLTVEEVDTVMGAVASALQLELGAAVRG